MMYGFTRSGSVIGAMCPWLWVEDMGGRENLSAWRSASLERRERRPQATKAPIMMASATWQQTVTAQAATFRSRSTSILRVV